MEIFMTYKSIEVVPYNSNWPQLFEAEADFIKQKLGDNFLEIHHVGSTSVPGLCAKPIIDIILVVRNSAESISPLESIGFKFRGEMNIPFRSYFSKKTEIPVHLHVYEPGSAEIELNVLFRNFLRSNSKACAEYASLKIVLAEEQKNQKNAPPMFSHYTLGKNTFIQKILQQAGFDKLRLMHCTHYAEWEATKAYRQKYFFDKVPMADPYTWTFNHAEHTHFVLYKGIQIIGYVHLQHWPNQRAAMRIIVIDEAFGNQKYGSYLLGLCERWLKLQGVKSLHVQSSPQAYNFYCQHGYTEMPFDDPDNHESDLQDIDVGKVL
jgi:GrpB-like predicted nucleotidyltransferase (UPF0157 family)/ribosomal protein S18 acetylase RimI-like enzyme